MSETIDNFLAEPKVLADTPQMQEAQESLGAIRLISDQFPAVVIPFHVKSILQRRIDSYQERYDEIQDHITDELLTGVMHDGAIEALSIPRDNSQISGAVVIELPKKVEKPQRLEPAFKVDAPRAFGHS